MNGSAKAFSGTLKDSDSTPLWHIQALAWRQMMTIKAEMELTVDFAAEKDLLIVYLF